MQLAKRTRATGEMTTDQVALQLAGEIERRIGPRSDAFVVMICGPPGTGKTTLCHAIKKQLRPDSVAVLCDDRELYSRAAREELGINGIDRRARDMEHLKADLASFAGGSAIPDKVYERSNPDSPEVKTLGSLQPRPVVLLDGFTWCYENFDGLWDLKYVFLPHSFEDSEKMSMDRDWRERSYSQAEAESKHASCYRTYMENIDRVRQGARRLYRVSRRHEFTPEGSSSRS